MYGMREGKGERRCWAGLYMGIIDLFGGGSKLAKTMKMEKKKDVKIRCEKVEEVYVCMGVWTQKFYLLGPGLKREAKKTPPPQNCFPVVFQFGPG